MQSSAPGRPLIFDAFFTLPPALHSAGGRVILPLFLAVPPWARRFQMEKKLLFLVNPKAGRNKSRGPLFDAVSVLCQA